MKYSINIDQKAIAENFPDLDLKDAAILAFIKDFTHKRGVKKKFFNNLIYYWIAYSQVISEMPLLKIRSKRMIYNRFKKLAKCQIIEFHPDNQATGETYFCFGEGYDICISGRKNISEGYENNFRGGVSEISEGYENNFRGGMKNISDKHSINEPSIIHSINEPKEEVLSEAENEVNSNALKDGDSKEKSSAKKESSDWQKAQQVLRYLNSATGSTYPILPNIARPIFRKITDGAKVEKMLMVVDLKTKQWAGTRYEVNLTIKTLFGDKYWDYEQEVNRVVKNPSILKPKGHAKSSNNFNGQADVVSRLIAELDEEYGK